MNALAAALFHSSVEAAACQFAGLAATQVAVIRMFSQMAPQIAEVGSTGFIKTQMQQEHFLYLLNPRRVRAS